MPLQSIVTAQLLLFGAGWLLAAVLVRDQRRPALHWALYCLLQGAEVLAAGLPPMTARIVLAPLVMGGFIASLRGVEMLARGRSTLDRWWLFAFVAVVALVAAAPQLPLATPLQRSVQICALYGGISALLLGSLAPLWRALAPAFGRTAATLALLPSALVGSVQGALMVWEAFVGPLTQTLGREFALTLGAVVSASATTLFNLCTLALFVASLVRQLRHSATHDHLTGLANRREGETALESGLERRRREGTALSVLVLDLDHFKRVNDEHGHEGGDRALVFAAQTLRSVVRATDTVVRWGGEEFVVVMPGADPAAAGETAERLRREIEARAPQVLGHPLTASIGLAAADAGTSAQQAVARADAALYRAKHEGRNRVCVAEAAEA